MLSVRLPPTLETRLASFCESMHTTRTAVVQQALEQHLKVHAFRPRGQNKKDPLEAMIGSGNRKFTTDELMRLTRGDAWNKP